MICDNKKSGIMMVIKKFPLYNLFYLNFYKLIYGKKLKLECDICIYSIYFLRRKHENKLFYNIYAIYNFMLGSFLC